jgi:CCR4-NOT transcription complex subunit 1 TTP binding domain
MCRKGEAGVNELVQQLREMAAGSDIETAEYMIQDIFEEYPFFAQYPSDKLRTTAALIGSMIAQAVFVGRSLFLALKMIIECLEVCILHRGLLLPVGWDCRISCL